jgi:hypothetical protein
VGAELDQLALVQAGGAQAPLDVGLVVVGLGLGDAAQAVGVDGQQPQGRLVLERLRTTRWEGSLRRI